MDPIIVSYSELDTYRQCPLKHELAYKQRWTKPPEAGARTRGTIWHALMEAHYTKLQEVGLPRAPTIPLLNALRQQARDILYTTHGGEDREDLELLEWMYEGYLDHYGVDGHWDILAIENRAEVPLRTAHGRKSRYRLKMRVDLLVKDITNGLTWVVDHKSGRNLPTDHELAIDDQFGLYVWGMRQLGYPVTGAIHNAARTQRNLADYSGYTGKSKPQTLQQRMSRVLLSRGDHELTALALDAYNTAYNAYPPKSKTLPLYSSPNPRECGWKCDYKEVHLAMRTGRDPLQLLPEFGFEQDFTRH